MVWLNNMKIGKKLIFGYALLLLATGIIGIVSYMRPSENPTFETEDSLSPALG